MDIEDAREKKYELDESLAKLLDAFCEETGLVIESINLERHEQIAPARSRYVYVVDTSVGLESCP